MALTITRGLIGFCLIFFMACEGDPASDQAEGKDSFAADLPEHFEYERVNDDLVYAYHRSGLHNRAEGYLRNGERDGYWFSFYVNRHKIEKIEHYVQGELHGPLREFSLNGRMTKEAFYEDGVLNGPYTLYKFGFLLEQAYYKDGKLEGEVRKFFDENELRGMIQERISYKDGKMHGSQKFYNEKGEVVLEYKYEEGVRIDEEK